MSCKRNWTFLWSDNGGRTAAILTSITTTSKRRYVDLFEHLPDVFQPISTRSQNNIDALLPDKWKAAYQLTIN
jgi:phage terminase Nu1 subunit (DNA packaging protein)